MTTPTGGGNDSSTNLVLGVDTVDGIKHVEDLKDSLLSSADTADLVGTKIGTATIRSVKSLKDLATGASVTKDAFYEFEKAQRDVIAAERDAEAARQASINAATGLIAKLNDLNATFGMSTGELYRYRAAQLGVAEAAEPLIANLERLTRAEFEHTTQQRRDIELYNAQGVAMKRQSALEQERDVWLHNERQKNHQDYIKWWEQEAAASEKRAMADINWSAKSLKARIDDLAKLQAYQESNRVSQETLQNIFPQSAFQQLPQLTQMTAEYEATLQRTHGAHAAVTDSTNALSAAMGNNRVRTEAIVIAHEALQGRFTRIPGSMMVMVEYLNAAAISFTGMGVGILAAVAGLGLLAYEMARGQSQAKEFNNAIFRTNGYAGETRDSLEALAHSVGALHGGYTQAYEAAAQLTKSGKFTRDQISEITLAVVDLEHAFGNKLGDSIKEFESLSVRGTNAAAAGSLQVTKGLEKLDEQYHFVTVSLMEEVIQLEREGKAREASEIAMRAYAKESERASKESITNIGWIESAWNFVTASIKGAGQAMADVGKKSSDGNREQTLINKLAKNKDGSLLTDTNKMSQTQLYQFQQYIALEKELDDANQKAIKTAKETEARSNINHILATRAVADKTLMKKTDSELKEALATFNKENEDLESYTPGYLEANKTYLAEREAAIIKAHTRKEAIQNDGHNTELTNELRHVDEMFKLSKDAAESNEKLTKEAIKANQISEDAGYAQLRANRKEELQALDVWLQDRNKVLNKYRPQTPNDRAHLAGLRTDTEDKFNNTANDIGAASSKNDEDRAAKDDIAFQKLMDTITKANNKELEGLDKAIEKQREHNAEIGKTKEQIELARQAQVDALNVVNQREAEAIRLVLANQEITRNMTKEDRELYETRLSFLDRQIAKTKELADQHAAGAELQANSPDKLAADADKLSRQWKTAGEVIAKSLTDGFGKGGKAAGDMFKAITTGQSRQFELEKNLIKEKAAANGLKNQEVLLTQANDKFNQASAQNRLNEYGNMAGAAAGFFDTQSTGYKTLMAISQVFHAAELAMSIAELVPKATAAILNQGNGDPYSAFARMATMAAIVAGLGVAVGSFSGGNVEDQSAKYRQANQGTGSVLGDSTAKSDSIAKSLEILDKNSELGLVHSQQMVTYLKTISSSMSGLAKLVAQNTGLSTGKVDGITEGTKLDSLGVLIGGGPFSLLAAQIPVVGKLLSKLFGTTTNVIDQGIIGTSATLEEIQKLGIKVQSYATINTTKKFLGISYSNSTKDQTEALSPELNQQFTKIIQSLAQGINSAADSIGVGGDAFTTKLNSFVVDIGHISTKGLTGDQIQKQFEAVFSKLGDDMAKFAFDGLSEFQKVGEGYFETLSRVAVGLQTTKDVYAVLGKNFDKTGMEAIAFSENLIDLAGGIDKLDSDTKAFVTGFLTESEALKPIADSVKEALAKLNMSQLTTVELYAKQTMAALDGTEAGSQLYAALIKLAPAFLEVQKAEEKLQEAEEKRYSSQLDLQLQIAQLEKNTASASAILATQRAIELAKMDQSLVPLQKRVWVLQDEADVLSQMNDASDSAFGKLSDSINHEKDLITASYKSRVDAAKAAFDAQKEAAQDQLKIAQTNLSTIKSIFDTLTNALKNTEIQSDQLDAARRRAAQEYLRSIAGTDLTKATGLKSALDAISKPSEKMFGSFLEYARDQAKTAQLLQRVQQNSSAQVDYAQLQIDGINGTISAIGAASKVQLAVMEAQYNADIAAQDKILEDAKFKNDLLKGINDTLLTVRDALRAFMVASSAAAAQGIQNAGITSGSTTTAGDTIESFYKNVLGRSSDAAGKDYWMNVLNQGASLDNIAKGFTSSDEYKSLHPFADGTSYVPKDMPAYIHEGEAIVPKADNQELLSRLRSPTSNNAALLQEIKGLRQEVSQLRGTNTAENIAMQKDLATVAGKIRRWDNNGMPDIRDEGTS